MAERVLVLPLSVLDGRRTWWVGQDDRFHDIRYIRRARLPGGVGDESSFITDEQVDQFMESLRRNDQHLDERTSRPMIGVGVDTTL